MHVALATRPHLFPTKIQVGSGCFPPNLGAFGLSLIPNATYGLDRDLDRDALDDGVGL